MIPKKYLNFHLAHLMFRIRWQAFLYTHLLLDLITIIIIVVSHEHNYFLCNA